ncbi:MAG: hypothetical protein AAGJ34_10250 [Pseudomonadota bacterium]
MQDLTDSELAKLERLKTEIDRAARRRRTQRRFRAVFSVLRGGLDQK